MFGLSAKEVLIGNIKNACINQRSVYKEAIKDFAIKHKDDTDDDEAQASKEIERISKTYFDSVYEAMRDTFKLSMPDCLPKFGMCIMSPSLCGLPDFYTTDVFCDYGINAGATFAMCFFVLKGKPISPNDFKTVQMLNHFQKDVMDDVLREVGTEMGVD